LSLINSCAFAAKEKINKRKKEAKTLIIINLIIKIENNFEKKVEKMNKKQASSIHRFFMLLIGIHT